MSDILTVTKTATYQLPFIIIIIEKRKELEVPGVFRDFHGIGFPVN